MAKFSVWECFACKVSGQHRSTRRKKPQGRPDEEALTAGIIRLASRYGRDGYRRITAMLRSEGWAVNARRIEPIWRREGMKVPQKQPKRGRLWLNDGSCIRLRPKHPNHVWPYDFVEGQTHNGRKFRMLNIIDEFTRECLAIRIDRKLNSTNVIGVPSDLFILRGVPGHVHSDNGGVHCRGGARVDRGRRRKDRLAWLQAAGTGGHCLARATTRISATICPADGTQANHALRLKPTTLWGQVNCRPFWPKCFQTLWQLFRP
ncbi:hypothetical protein HNR59_001114 [Aquamicrobium lusatiense]|uniref:Integrase catalytic domain-containing protein n=1 Tax=Aquamicrobium lusatiense TaxID=89772 RepID=A0A7W9S0P1_9HYPH|nr:hypothetical protein [Aquamicrobium lusatiense]